MKNITVSIDEHTHRQARIRAAELGTSVSALVRNFLNRLVAKPLEEKVTEEESETPLERRHRLLREAVADLSTANGALRTAHVRESSPGMSFTIAMRFVDTNVLLYAAKCSDPQEAGKRLRSPMKLLDKGDLALSVQVLQEFYYQVTTS